MSFLDMGTGEVSKILSHSAAAKVTTAMARQADSFEHVARHGTKKKKLVPKLAKTFRGAMMSSLKPVNPREPSTFHALVVKSYVPGKGWVSASKLTKDQLKTFTRPRPGVSPEDRVIRERAGAVRRFVKEKADSQGHTGTSSRKVMKPRFLPNKTMTQNAGENTAAFALKTGGRKAPGKVYARSNADKVTLDHEQVHVAPKRSSYRFLKVTGSPRKRMREEARADYLSGVDYKRGAGNSGYAEAAIDEGARRWAQGEQGRLFSRPQMTNYRHIQDRMRAAGTKQKNVSKSFTEMPGSFTEDLSEQTPQGEEQSPTRNENLTALRVRDLKTGRFVAGPTLVTKRGEKRAAAFDTLLSYRQGRKKEKELEDDLSVTLKKIKRNARG